MAARRPVALGADDLDELVPELLNNETEWPLDQFPADLQDWANGYATALGCYPVVFMLPLLAAVAGLVGTSGALQWNGGLVAVSIFAVVCAPSGSRKSAAYQVISRALHALEANVTEAATNAANANGPVAPPSPSRNPQRFSFEGGTFAALRQRLEAQPDGRRSMLMLFEESISLLSWMGGLAHDQRAYEQDMATLLVLYDGHPWARELVGNAAAGGAARNDERDGNGPTAREGPATGVSVATWSQPAMLVLHLAKPDPLAFWARWEVVFVGRRHIANIAERPDHQPAVTVEQLLAAVYNGHRGQQLRRYTLSAEATTAYFALFQRVEDDINALNGQREPEARVLGKLQGKILKFAVLVHVLLHAFRGVEDAPLEVSAESVRIADAVVRYHANTHVRARHAYLNFREARTAAQAAALAVGGASSNSNVPGGGARSLHMAMRAIAPQWRHAAAAIRQRGSFLTPRMLQQRAPHSRTAGEAEVVLDQLAAHGLVTRNDDARSRRWVKAVLANEDAVLPNQRQALHHMGISIRDFMESAQAGYLQGP